jgi:hypothetical protein
MNRNSSSQEHAQTAGMKEAARITNEIRIGDWVAPMIAWMATLALGLAIAGFLLGQE